ncbi:PepSY domain-containing protein [Roseovarius ramblicola]|uniref:PepSY domain-containing protein n=1 Tax=Roseovarius ramblicola TaxID=2022336 RepID=A0ABV5HYB4_9RHOB
MKKTLIALSVIALLPAGVAVADDDDCVAPRGQWKSREAAMQAAEQHGWTVRRFKIDDGCYEIEGRDSTGREIEAKLDPATLQMVEMEYEDDEEDDDDRGNARNPAPAGTVAPPQNGLFGNGAPPKAQVN